ncbi:MAG: rod-binding protein [Planctomycetota bacterium]
MSDSHLPPVATSGPGDAELARLVSGGGDRRARLEKAAHGLESVFTSMMVQTMRESLGEEGLFGGLPGSDIYSGFFDRMMGDALSERGGIGIAEMVIRDGMRAEQAVAPEDVAARAASRAALQRGLDAFAELSRDLAADAESTVRLVPEIER